MNYDTGINVFGMIGILVLVAILIECAYLWINDKNVLSESKLLFWCDGTSKLEEVGSLAVLAFLYSVVVLAWPLMVSVIIFCSIVYFLRFVMRIKKVVDKVKKK